MRKELGLSKYQTGVFEELAEAALRGVIEGGWNRCGQGDEADLFRGKGCKDRPGRAAYELTVSERKSEVAVVAFEWHEGNRKLTCRTASSGESGFGGVSLRVARISRSRIEYMYMKCCKAASEKSQAVRRH